MKRFLTIELYKLSLIGALSNIFMYLVHIQLFAEGDYDPYNLVGISIPAIPLIISTGLLILASFLLSIKKHSGLGFMKFGLLLAWLYYVLVVCILNVYFIMLIFSLPLRMLLVAVLPITLAFITYATFIQNAMNENKGAAE